MFFVLVQYAGSGLASVNKYHYGFFSAAIKLPPGDSSGVVVAFYVSIYAYMLYYSSSYCIMQIII